MRQVGRSTQMAAAACGAHDRYWQQRDRHDPANLGSGRQWRGPAISSASGRYWLQVPRCVNAIVNKAMSSKNAPAPVGCSQRLTSTVSTKVSAAPLTMADRLTSEPRAIMAVADGAG